jgi:hypothetical protein
MSAPSENLDKLALVTGTGPGSDLEAVNHFLDGASRNMPGNKLDCFILIMDGWTGTKEIHCFLDHSRNDGSFSIDIVIG